MTLVSPARGLEQLDAVHARHVDVAHDQGRVGVGVEPSFLVVWLVRICAAPVNGVAVPLWVQSYVVAPLPAL